MSIRERPAEAEDRAVPDGDLFFGSNNSQIATLVERQTRYLMLARVAGKDTETVVNALIKQAHKTGAKDRLCSRWNPAATAAEDRRSRP